MTYPKTYRKGKWRSLDVSCTCVLR